MTPTEIAQVCHEANKGLCDTQGDTSQMSWSEAPSWQRMSAVEGVGKALEGASPEELHQSWCDHKIREGWTFGETKDAVVKTHPCLVPYAELPSSQRVKDTLFAAVVLALSQWNP